MHVLESACYGPRLHISASEFLRNRAQHRLPSHLQGPSYYWQEQWIEEELGVSHAHGHDQLPLVSPLIRGDLRSAEQHAVFQQTIHVHRQHFHGIWQYKLKEKTLVS